MKPGCNVTDTRSICWLDFQPFFSIINLLWKLLTSKIIESTKRFNALRGSLNNILYVVTSAS